MSAIEPVPTVEDAAAAVQRRLGIEVRRITRFLTGLAHYVYDVLTVDGQKLVVRMGSRDQAPDFTNALHWHHLLEPRGVPVPQILDYETSPADGSFPFMILERLPGRDLHDEYPRLSSEQRRALAGRIVEIQGIAGSLPPGPGFGYARSYDDRSLHPAWVDVLHADLERSRTRMRAAGVVAPECVDRVADLISRFLPYLSDVEPRCFLDDTTTKNVIVDGGRLSGIVDVDWVCFGDPLLTLGLTHMALLSAGYETDYIRYWAEALELDDKQSCIVRLYTAIFCVNFLGEMGQRFNRDAPLAAEEGDIAKLMALLDELLAAL